MSDTERTGFFEGMQVKSCFSGRERKRGSSDRYEALRH